MAWIVCPLAVAGCILLFVNLSMFAKIFFVCWAAIGLVLMACSNISYRTRLTRADAAQDGIHLLEQRQNNEFG